MKLRKKTKTILQQLVLTPTKVHQKTFKKRQPGRKLEWDKYDIFDRKKFFPQEEEFSVVGIDHNEEMMPESNSVLELGNVAKGSKENEPALSCGVCKKTFTVKRKYNGHVKRAHVKNIKTEEVKQLPLSSTSSPLPEEGNTPEPGARPSTPEIPQLVTPEVSSLISSTPELSPTPEIPPERVEESSDIEPAAATNDQIPDENDKNNYCKVCQKTFVQRKVYRQHVKKVHHVNLTPLKKSIHDPNNPPDIDDPNHYCTPCGKHYYNRFIYRKHLRQVHKLSLLKVPKAVPDHRVQPDPDDPDFFCQSCQIVYGNQQKYRQHVSYVHYIKTEPPTKPYPVHDPDLVVNVYDPENTSCKICKKDYQNKKYYEKHRRKAHRNGKNKQPVAGVPRTDIEPDLNDPNHHCRSCKKTLASRWTYLRHLKLVHPLVNLTPLQSSKKTKSNNHTASSSSGKKKKKKKMNKN